MIMVDAFGTIALVAMTPTISIQVVGLMYKIKLSHSKSGVTEDADILIIESLGEDYVEHEEQNAEPKINKQAISDIVGDDDIEIIEFSCEYEDSSEKESSESLKG